MKKIGAALFFGSAAVIIAMAIVGMFSVVWFGEKLPAWVGLPLPVVCVTLVGGAYMLGRKL